MWIVDLMKGPKVRTPFEQVKVLVGWGGGYCQGDTRLSSGTPRPPHAGATGGAQMGATDLQSAQGEKRDIMNKWEITGSKKAGPGVSTPADCPYQCASH